MVFQYPHPSLNPRPNSLRLIEELRRNGTEAGGKVDIFPDEHDRTVVLDNGSGMSAEECARVMDAGEKGAGSDGEGLGLAIVQRLAAEQNLDFRLASRVGKGTCASLTLPVWQT